MKRSSLKSDPQAARAWQERSQATMRAKAAENAATPLKRSPIAKQREVVVKRKKIKAVSKTRAVQNREYSAKRLLFLEANPFCKPCHDGGTTTLATQIHHMAGRDGERLNDDSKWLSTCHDCHTWITANPIDAMTRGYSLSRHRTA